MNKTNGVWGMIAGAALLTTMAGCQCCQSTPPVRECLEQPMDVSKDACAPVQAVSCPTTVTTVIHHDGVACPALPPVGEITVVRNNCLCTKMVFVAVRPSDDRCFDVENRNFERPWPWGPLRAGNIE